MMETGLKEICKIDQFPPDRPIEFDNDINIAGRDCFSACIGAEDPE